MICTQRVLSILSRQALYYQPPRWHILSKHRIKPSTTSTIYSLGYLRAKKLRLHDSGDRLNLQLRPYTTVKAYKVWRVMLESPLPPPQAAEWESRSPVCWPWAVRPRKVPSRRRSVLCRQSCVVRQAGNIEPKFKYCATSCGENPLILHGERSWSLVRQHFNKFWVSSRCE